MSLSLLRSQCVSNQRIIQQKLQLLDVVERCNDLNIFQRTCPLVGASIGQHLRHSNDHMELIIKMVSQILKEVVDYPYPQEYTTDDGIKGKYVLQYDVRKRGGNDETILHSARTRILSMHSMLHTILKRTTKEEMALQILERPIWASFLLTSEASTSSADDMPLLISNVGRELSFVAHHALHHLALIKIIGVNIKAFTEKDLPLGFGKAPSTLQHDKAVVDQTR